MACVSSDFRVIYAKLRDDYMQFSQTPLRYDSFWDELSSLTKKTVLSAQEVLKAHVPELFIHPEQISVVCTGSDSREEKCGLGSPVECIIIAPQKELTPTQQEIVAKILRTCKESEPLFFPSVEQKWLDHGFIANYEKEGGIFRTIPTRAFDSVFLAGDQATFLRYKQKVIEELEQKQVDEKLFKKESLDRSLQSLGQELSGAPIKSPYIIVDSGTVFYEKRGRRGIKHDIIRSVQYSVAHCIFKNIINKKISPQEALHIPASIIGRLEWLREKNFTQLSSDEFTTLKRLYTQASSWYVSLNAFFISQEDQSGTIVMPFHPEELRPLMQETLSLCKKLIK